MPRIIISHSLTNFEFNLLKKSSSESQTRIPAEYGSLSYLKTKPYLAQVLFWPFAAFLLRMKYRVYKSSDKRAMCLVVPKFN